MIDSLYRQYFSVELNVSIIFLKKSLRYISFTNLRNYFPAIFDVRSHQYYNNNGVERLINSTGGRTFLSEGFLTFLCRSTRKSQKKMAG